MLKKIMVALFFVLGICISNSYAKVGLGVNFSNLGYGAVLDWRTPVTFLGVRAMVLTQGHYKKNIIEQSVRYDVLYRPKLSVFGILDFYPMNSFLRISVGGGHQDNHSRIYYNGNRGILKWHNKASFYGGAGVKFNLSRFSFGADMALIYKGSSYLKDSNGNSLLNTSDRIKKVSSLFYYGGWVSFDF